MLVFTNGRTHIIVVVRACTSAVCENVLFARIARACIVFVRAPQTRTHEARTNALINQLMCLYVGVPAISGKSTGFGGRRCFAGGCTHSGTRSHSILMLQPTHTATERLSHSARFGVDDRRSPAMRCVRQRRLFTSPAAPC